MRALKSLSVATAATLALLLCAPMPASAQANCDWYAKTAVRQQQINASKQCGLTGLSWHTDLAAHRKWCQGVPPDAWKAEAQKRSQQLQACEQKKG
ncbi:MAG: hypothetical protein R3D67_09480 [Hyphomicrobiaceae bacterium]